MNDDVLLVSFYGHVKKLDVYSCTTILYAYRKTEWHAVWVLSGLSLCELRMLTDDFDCVCVFDR